MQSTTYSFRHGHFSVLALLIILALSTMALAQVPDPIMCNATSANSQPVSVYMLPNGGGWPLTNTMLLGGDRTDATITLTLLDEAWNPITNFPAEDMFLVTCCDLAPCWVGTIADGNTNAQGQTTFSNPLMAGGWGSGAQVMIGTWPTPEFPVEISGWGSFQFNSPDITSDSLVNLSDIAAFAGDFFGAYHYRCDFYWDGVLNLSDVALLAQGIGAACP